MEWFVGTTLFVRERGTYSFREIVMEHNNKTLAYLVLLIQKALNSQLPVLAILKDDGSRIESDLDVCFISTPQPLEVVFSNKFYWVVTDEQRREWTQEFSTIVGPHGHLMSGDQARSIFSTSRVAFQDLAIIWDLADMDKDNHLSLVEFILAKFLIFIRQQGQNIPNPLPQSLIETLTQTPQPMLPRTHVNPKLSPRKSQKKLNISNTERAIWYISQRKYNAYAHMFNEYSDGSLVTGQTALTLFSRSGIDRMSLARVWTLSDIDQDNNLNSTEFKIALHLIANLMKGVELPSVLPQDLIASAHPSTRKKGHKPSSSSGPSQSQQVQVHNINPTSNPTSPVSQKQISSPSNSWQQYPQPNILLPSQSFNIGQWTPAPTASCQDIIQNIAAGIRKNMMIQQQQHMMPGQGTLVPQQQQQNMKGSMQMVVDAEQQFTGVIKIEPGTIVRGNLLGGGTFGRVWKGTWKGETVAIKDITYRSEKEVDMWKREVQLLSILQNENYLVGIRGYAVTTEHLTIVMEFMDGGSLYDAIHKHKVPWSMLQKVRIVRHIAKAIESIHKLNIVHRDIKSMNILLDHHGIAKLADLGCSRMVRAETMTVGVGSPLWMAPEVANSNSYSYPSDIFSYGVVLYEIFNEKLPDYDQSTRRVIIPTDCTGYRIIKECISSNPDRRPTASQVIDSIDVLISTFTTTVARVVRNYHAGEVKDLPREDDVKNWYIILLSYDRDTFDILLSTGLAKNG